jgi:hypothetical protein
MSTALLRDAFFPYALTISVPDFNFLDRCSTKRSNQKKNELVAAVGRAAARLRKSVGPIRRELSTSRSKTPFLLPLQNFRSDVLRNILARGANELAKAADCDRTLAEFRNLIERPHPRVALDHDRVRHFRDGRGLFFKAPPARWEHGVPHPSGGGKHLPDCLFSSRVRLGAPYRASFHYDCQYANGRITENFPNCHSEDQEIRGQTHVNISPNDWVR